MNHSGNAEPDSYATYGRHAFNLGGRIRRSLGNDDLIRLASPNTVSACGAAIAKCRTAHLFIGLGMRLIHRCTDTWHHATRSAIYSLKSNSIRLRVRWWPSLRRSS